MSNSEPAREKRKTRQAIVRITSRAFEALAAKFLVNCVLEIIDWLSN
ncbi:hypothetical protein CFELI_13965 [Corynebacterium felinum]|uniref:Uncharacterized protein n=1 Tax=Corynebacterium felinum TaxID=131318 RepID=A0ABU2B6E4_9CORY|nr:hypothetical protein [Corynebacterium felinum]WJY96364.1 hypothetical protein CFELI_13965 [Corynebacterium felinum]